MTEVDRALVRRKLAAMSRNLGDLAPVEGLSLAEYVTDRLRRKAVERLLQEVVDTAVDVNLHLLRTLQVQLPGDYYTSFLEVGRQNIIAADLAKTLAPAAGLRNRLVHEYDEIDDSLVLRAVGDARRDFGTYIAAVERYLELAE